MSQGQRSDYHLRIRFASPRSDLQISQPHPHIPIFVRFARLAREDASAEQFRSRLVRLSGQFIHVLLDLAISRFSEDSLFRFRKIQPFFWL